MTRPLRIPPDSWRLIAATLREAAALDAQNLPDRLANCPADQRATMAEYEVSDIRELEHLAELIEARYP